VSIKNKRESAKGRRPNYLEETLYCIGTFQLLMKLPRITQNNVGRCLKSLVNIKNSSIVKANLEWLTSQGFIERVSTGGVDLGYRLTTKGMVHFAILNRLATYVLVPAIIKFLIIRAKEIAKAVSEEFKIDLGRTWIEDCGFREETLRMLRLKYRDSVSIIPTIIKIIGSSVRLEIAKPGSTEKQRGLQNYLEVLDLIRSALSGGLVPMNFQVGDLMMIYRSAMDMCSLALGVENVGVETLRSYIDEVVHNNTIVATA
jgi:hypothetical protein